FYILPLLVTQAVLDINYIVLIHNINKYSHYLSRILIVFLIILVSL
ncbi:hypothetical protein CPAR01_10220, partial [Colletotrichum paranaense]